MGKKVTVEEMKKRIQEMRNKQEEIDKLFFEIKPESRELPFESLAPAWFRNWNLLPENIKTEEAEKMTEETSKLMIQMLDFTKENLLRIKQREKNK